jgi:hypothetical protein
MKRKRQVNFFFLDPFSMHFARENLMLMSIHKRVEQWKKDHTNGHVIVLSDHEAMRKNQYETIFRNLWSQIENENVLIICANHFFPRGVLRGHERSKVRTILMLRMLSSWFGKDLNLNFEANMDHVPVTISTPTMAKFLENEEQITVSLINFSSPNHRPKANLEQKPPADPCASSSKTLGLFTVKKTMQTLQGTMEELITQLKDFREHKWKIRGADELLGEWALRGPLDKDDMADLCEKFTHLKPEDVEYVIDVIQRYSHHILPDSLEELNEDEDFFEIDFEKLCYEAQVLLRDHIENCILDYKVDEEDEP